MNFHFNIYNLKTSKFLLPIFWGRDFVSSFILVSCFCLVSSCSSVRDIVPVDQELLAKHYGFEKVVIKGGDFFITTFQKVTNRSLPYVFYLEGDGAAFNGKYQISKNPTPRKQMLMHLASLDPRPNVVYVARPCQYTDMELNPTCKHDPSFWTNKRLSEEVIISMNHVINKVNTNNNKFSLVGFSGGGAVAVLVAARNDKVKDIITVAGNLDIKAFVEYHNVSPMVGSMNPIEVATMINHLPQIHLSGGKDKIVSPIIGDKFVQASGNGKCVHHKIIEDASHNKGWDVVWNYVLHMPLYCY